MAWIFGIRDNGDVNDISKPPNRHFSKNGCWEYVGGAENYAPMQWDSASEAIKFMEARKQCSRANLFSWMKNCNIQLEQL